MRLLVRALFPIVLLVVLFLGVLFARPTTLFRRTIPDQAYHPQRCTWYCHNHGCRHAPKFPGWFTSDEGAFGGTVHGLYWLGSLMTRDRFLGYGMANLLVFCFGWPVGTYALWLLAWKQNDALRAARAKQKQRAK